MAGALARHLLAEYYGCDPAVLDDLPALQQLVAAAAAAARTTLLKLEMHRFSPQGVTGVGILAESHLAIHTWPEHRFASVEVFVCGEEADPDAGEAAIRARLRPRHVEKRLLPRGRMDLVRAHRLQEAPGA